MHQLYYLLATIDKLVSYVPEIISLRSWGTANTFISQLDSCTHK